MSQLTKLTKGYLYYETLKKGVQETLQQVPVKFRKSLFDMTNTF